MVGLTELRAGIENANSGNFPPILPMPALPKEPEEEKSDAESGIVKTSSDEDTEMLANRDDSNIQVVSDHVLNQRRKNSM